MPKAAINALLFLYLLIGSIPAILLMVLPQLLHSNRDFLNDHFLVYLLIGGTPRIRTAMLLGQATHPDPDWPRAARTSTPPRPHKSRRTCTPRERAGWSDSAPAAGERLGYMAAEETGLGRGEDKAIKNRLVTTRTPGPEDLEPLVQAWTCGYSLLVHVPVIEQPQTVEEAMAAGIAPLVRAAERAARLVSLGNQAHP